MNRFRELVLQSLRVGEDYNGIVITLEQLLAEMKTAQQYLKAYNEKDFHP